MFDSFLDKVVDTFLRVKEEIDLIFFKSYYFTSSVEHIYFILYMSNKHLGFHVFKMI